MSNPSAQYAKKQTNEQVLNPSVYEYDGKQYASFSTIQDDVQVGRFNLTREYNIWYCFDDQRWIGDIIDFSGWRDLEEDETMQLVQRFNLDRAIKKIKK